MVKRTDRKPGPTIHPHHIRALLASPVDRPVLYIKLDEDTGAPGGLDVWPSSLVPHQTVVATRTDIVDMLGDDPDGDTIDEYLPQLQDDVDNVYVELP